MARGNWLTKLKQKFSRRKLRQLSNFSTSRTYVSNQQLLTRAKLIRAGAVLSFLLVVGGIFTGGALFAWYARDLPDPDNIVRREGFSTKIFDSQGNLLYDVFNDENRVPVKLEQVPEYLRQATIAIEDKEFYTHGGYDPKGLIRAAYLNIFQGSRVGGSTLTQQLVKNGLLTSEKRISRKIKEFVLAVQIERKFNKDEILQMYLNEIPYGGTAWGVAAAAETYFGKNVSELTLTESAILAGLPQRPSYYTPFGSYPDAYIGRTTHVLRRMREDGYITPEQEQASLEELSEVKFASNSGTIKAPHFVFYVKEQLEEMFSPELVENGGLRVTTTLDLELQNEAQAIVAEEIGKVEDLGIGNGAAVVIDTNTGHILSMVGSKDFNAEDTDGQVNVTLSLRQPGSTIKPVTYALALQKGFTPASMIMDVKTEFPGGQGQPPYIPVNYDGTYRGPVSLRNSLGSSLNVPAVKLLAQVGIRDMLQLAYDMGLNTLEPTDANMKRFGLAVTLGGGEVRLIDLASSYSAFSNGGYRVEPVSILKVEDQNGKVMYEHKQTTGKKVLDEKVAFLITDILRDNNARLMTFGTNSLLNMGGRPIAVKTGTTNDRRDNWAIGWSRDTIVGVWVGNNDNSPMKSVASGVSGASPIWRNIMLKAIEKRPAAEFEVPDGVESVFVDAVSGYPEHDDFPSRSEYVIKGTLPALPDPIHTKLKLCRGQNKLATLGQVSGNNYEEKEFFVFKEDDPISSEGNKWQEGIDAWLSSQGDSRYHPPTETCEGGENAVVRINKPEHEKNYDGDEIEIDMDVFADKNIEKLEIVINGSVKETLTSRPYKTKIKLSKGAYELKGRAILEGGEKVSSGTRKFGIGGVDWDANDKPEPTPSPSPSPSPSPTAAPKDEDEDED